MRIWLPTALVRETVGDEHSTSDQGIALPSMDGPFEAFQPSKSKAIVAHPTVPFVLAGYHVGDVLAYNSEKGEEIQVAHSHIGVAIKGLAITYHGLIESSKSSEALRPTKTTNL
jgi:hypothetical protein